MTPSFSLFNYLFTLFTDEVHTNTIDYISDGYATFPFVLVTHPRDERIENNDIVGVLRETVRVYGKRTDYVTVDEIVAKIDMVTSLRFSGNGYSFFRTGIDIIPLIEDLNGTQLIHYSITLTFNYNKER